MHYVRSERGDKCNKIITLFLDKISLASPQGDRLSKPRPKLAQVGVNAAAAHLSILSHLLPFNLDVETLTVAALYLDDKVGIALASSSNPLLKKNPPPPPGHIPNDANVCLVA